MAWAKRGAGSVPRRDFYALGRYNETAGRFVPAVPEFAAPENQVGCWTQRASVTLAWEPVRAAEILNQVDCGYYYASKSAADPNTPGRRLLFGWIFEVTLEPCVLKLEPQYHDSQLCRAGGLYSRLERVGDGSMPERS